MNDNKLEWLGSGCCAFLTVTQTQQMFQIVSLILTIITTLVTLAFTIYKWYKKAKEDGKIDKDEVIECIDIVKDGVEELSKEINKGDKE